MSELVAGSAELYPARVPGPFAGVIHLARAEARKGRGPALLAICPDGKRLGELVQAEQLSRLRRWAQGDRPWCADCQAYAEYLRTMSVREKRRQGEK